MALELKIPSVGESVTQVTIAAWLKEDGDYVEMDEAVAELESDKATVELNAESSGVLKILVEEGEDVEIGVVVATIDTDAAAPEGTAKPAEEKPAAATSAAPAAPKAEEKSANSSANYATGTPSPAAGKILAEKGISASAVKGTGKDGRLGLGSEEDMYTPEMVQSFDRRIVQIVCGGHHTAALDVDGNVWTFGFDDDGRLGHGVVGHQFLPLVIESLVRENIIQIACGCWHSAALSADGSIYTWGSCKSGQLGLGDKTSAHLPRLCLQGLGDRKIREIACGTTHTVAVDHEGTVWAWGKNEDGRLGLGDVDGDVTTPHAVNIPERMTHVAASVYGTAAWSVHDNAVYGDDA